jgi:hypothetical protein
MVPQLRDVGGIFPHFLAFSKHFNSTSVSAVSRLTPHVATNRFSLRHLPIRFFVFECFIELVQNLALWRQISCCFHQHFLIHKRVTFRLNESVQWLGLLTYSEASFAPPIPRMAWTNFSVFSVSFPWRKELYYMVHPKCSLSWVEMVNLVPMQKVLPNLGFDGYACKRRVFGA